MFCDLVFPPGPLRLPTFCLSLSRPTRAASCNTIQMEHSINSRARRKRKALRPPPTSALSSLFLLQQAAFCFCFCCFLQIESLSRQPFVLERIVSETRLVILPVYIDVFLSVLIHSREPRAKTKQTPCCALQQQNFLTNKVCFLPADFKLFSLC